MGHIINQLGSTANLPQGYSKQGEEQCPPKVLKDQYTQQVETEFNQKSLMKKTGPTKISSPGLSLGQGQTKMTKKSGCCPEARDGRSQIALQMA